MLGTARRAQGPLHLSIMRFACRATLLVAMVVLCDLLIASSALAATCTDKWTNAAGGSWNTASNWSAGVPTSSSVACIEKAGTYEVTLEPTGSASVPVTALKVGLGSGAQKLRIIATSATSGAYLRASEEVEVKSSGTVALTSSGAYESSLEVQSGKPLKNAGTISAEAGAGGERSLVGAVSNKGTVSNKATVSVAAGVSLDFSSGTFTNGSEGSVAGSGSGHLAVTGGTFVEGAGTTSGLEPVVMEGGTVEYAGSGESHVIARRYYSYLTGSLSAAQTLTIEGTCAAPAYVDLQGNVANAGTISLSSGGCSAVDYLRSESFTLTNTGTIKAEAGAGGERDLIGTFKNKGTLELAAGASAGGSGAFTNEGAVKAGSGSTLDFTSGTFTNGSGGSVIGSGSGHLAVTGGTFVEKAGTTSGLEPVVMEGGTVEYAGSGESHVIARRYYSYLTGSLSAAQTLTIEGTCAAPAYVDLQGNVANAGTIVLSSGGCSAVDYLRSESGTLTNTGTLKGEAGAGGERYLVGTFKNKGTVELATGAVADGSGTFTNEGAVKAGEGSSLDFSSGTFTNGSGGSVAGSGSGHVAVTGGTFVEGAGTTSGLEPVVVEGGTVEYVGLGESHVIARRYYSYLKGSLSAGQTFTIEGTCAAPAYVDTDGNVSNAGTIALSSGGCSAVDYLRSESGTLTNTGTLKGEAGAGGERYLIGTFSNAGAVEDAEGAALTLESGTFTNGSGGSVVGSGSGHLLVGSSSTFVEGAGTTSGPEPVVVEDGTVEYAGSGASSIIARSYSSELKGSLSAGQRFTIEGMCASSYSVVYAPADVANAGTIAFTSSGCSHEGRLEMASGKTLTNTGTIKAEAGDGGLERLRGLVVNNGSVTAANDATLTFDSGTFTNGNGGSVVGTASGHVEVYGSGTFVEGAGTTSGPEPVVVEDGTVEYAGSGSSHIIARYYSSVLKGSLSAGQTFTIEGTCASSYSIVYAPEDVSNGGTIAFTSCGCSHEARLEMASEKTLTNTGTIKAEAGDGGLERLRGLVVNNGSVTAANDATLTFDSGTFTNGTGGSVARHRFGARGSVWLGHVCRGCGHDERPGTRCG